MPPGGHVTLARSPLHQPYDARARLGLPISFGYPGGNASGPSALLMAMRRSAGPGNLPTLATVYDMTMQRPRAAVGPNRPNEFVAREAVAFLRSLGWRSARIRTLGATVEQLESDILLSLARNRAALVVSTAFGNDRWGTTGAGNLIVILGADRRGRFIVQDRALLAYTTGRYLIELGQRTRP